MANNIMKLGELKTVSKKVSQPRDPAIVRQELKQVAIGLKDCLAFMKERLAKNKSSNENK